VFSTKARVFMDFYFSGRNFKALVFIKAKIKKFSFHGSLGDLAI